MVKSIHSQASAVDVMSGFTGRSPMKLKESEKKMLEDGIAAASRTLWLLNSYKDKPLPENFIQMCEGAA